MKTLYSSGIHIANLFIKGASIFNKKLKLGVVGRSETFTRLKTHISEKDRTFWFHCASLGEYEQGLPVFQQLKEKYPTHKIVLSFFSPSGYEIRKDSPIADIAVYLPLDTKNNAKQFLDLVHPDLIVFVKYDIWPNFLEEIQQRQLRALLISATFRAEQSFFKSYGGFMRNALFAFEHIFTQDESSKILIEGIGYSSVSVSGDTRYDRVSHQLNIDNTLTHIETFKDNQTTIIFGSSWPEDDAIFIPLINSCKNKDIKFIIAPHNIKPSYTKSLVSQIESDTVSYTNMSSNTLQDYKVFILDTIGQLSKAYHYADIAYVGGAIGKTGLHNILEPAVFSLPIVIGNNHKKFPEAMKMQKNGGLFSISNQKEFNDIIHTLIEDQPFRVKSGQLNSDYITLHKGATTSIIEYLSRAPL
ncbi:3-deoxy-D-manno-octulosonic acid transferase [Winogradskyella immobilis]|uniref:3-deoxy-D-manno-octulosonic acid transferase n=1 Tax=Winogradskyella immobilis TaxID=2816852 RepID=A0ABS8EKS7_9FLAO|nr:glycosyltransferase N-terminal domain-containing protein [Winogradskyella immobilis]MCC1483814.1 3-deoxy-D-manno-octulosonic acid transferase [Winogradskyella immobilis]MCG0015908.1 3-deoxy-D-manno-octulosonic acid transferase [Winogradskyella immobilis]